MNYLTLPRSVALIFLLTIVFYSCSKSGGGGTVGGGGGGTLDPCTGVTIFVTANTTNPTAVANGSINASASGGSSAFNFSLNGGAFQSSGNFTGLAAGSYIVTAKNANGCAGTGSFILTQTSSGSCPGATISISATVTGNRLCDVNNGSIVATGSGGVSPYTFNINGGAFQFSNTFPGLGAGSFTIGTKDANGCTGTSVVAVGNLSAGPLFVVVKNLLQAECQSCHNSVVSEGGMNWEVDCNIVFFKDRIRERAVLANPSSMPPTGVLPASERAKITNWINAGGRFTD